MARQEGYLTPSEILDKYPDMEEKLGWGKKELGLFLKCNLLEGFYCRSMRRSMIKEESIFKLVTFANAAIENQKFDMN